MFDVITAIKLTFVISYIAAFCAKSQIFEQRGFDCIAVFYCQLYSNQSRLCCIEP